MLADPSVYLPPRQAELRKASARLAELDAAISVAEAAWMQAEEALAG